MSIWFGGLSLWDRAVRGNVGPAVDDVVWYLADPTENAGSVVRIAGSQIVVYSDGSVWRLLETDEEIVAWWLPDGAVFHADLEAGQYYWNGAVKTAGDLIDNGDGSFMAVAAINNAAGQQVVVFDYTLDMDAGARSGHLWALSATPSTPALRVQAVVAGSLGQTAGITNYITETNQTMSLQPITKGGVSETYPGTGRHRVLMRLINGQQVQYQPDNGEIRAFSASRQVTTVPNITKVSLGCGIVAASGAAQAVATAMTLHRLTVYNRDLTALEIEAVGRTGIAPPFHILGDSFVTLSRPQHNILKLIDGYVGSSSDAVGSTSLWEQAARYAANAPKWRSSTLVVADMGASTDMVAALQNILSRIGSDRWVVLESAPQAVIGTPDRIDWDARIAELAAFCGDRWVPTLEPAYAAGNGSADDNAEIAKGLWPLSLKTSLVDFHPSALGDDFMAATIHDALADRGWLPTP